MLVFYVKWIHILFDMNTTLKELIIQNELGSIKWEKWVGTYISKYLVLNIQR